MSESLCASWLLSACNSPLSLLSAAVSVGRGPWIQPGFIRFCVSSADADEALAARAAYYITRAVDTGFAVLGKIPQW